MSSRNAHPHPLEEALAHRFADPGLLKTALTHSSYVNENPDTAASDNERLEYLGDAVLDFLVADWLFREFPRLSEGQMTNLRALLVREETLARLAAKVNLGDHLLLGRGEEASGGRHRTHNLCAAFEALVGALYLDSDVATVRASILPLMQPELRRLLRERSVRDPKSLLQEWTQARYHVTPSYITVGEEGPDHAKRFTVQVLVNGEVWGSGSGPSKQAAAQRAAQAALERLQSSPARNEQKEDPAVTPGA